MQEYQDMTDNRLQIFNRVYETRQNINKYHPLIQFGVNEVVPTFIFKFKSSVFEFKGGLLEFTFLYMKR